MLPMTLVFRLAGVDSKNLDRLWSKGFSKGSHHERIRNLMQKAYRNGELPLFGGPWIRTYGEGSARRNQLFVNAVRILGDAADARVLSDAERQGRRDAWRIADFFKQNVPELKDAYLSETAPHMGIRETRR
jgi:hypothetical protein